MRYFHSVLYVILELVLEVWWEWEWFSNFEHFVRRKHEDYDTFGPAVATLMLIAHWMYFLAGIIELLNCSEDNSPHGVDAYLQRKRFSLLDFRRHELGMLWSNNNNDTLNYSRGAVRSFDDNDNDVNPINASQL